MTNSRPNSEQEGIPNGGQTRDRRWRRLSLRGLMLCCTVACVGFGIYYQHATANSTAIRFLDQQNVYHRLTRQPFNSLAKQPQIDAPNWQRKLMGDEYFLKVKVLEIYEDRAGDVEFWKKLRNHRKALQHVELVTIYGKGKPLGEEAQKTLAALKGLTDLHLLQCNLSSKWLASCRTLSELRQLKISRPPNTPIDSEALNSLTQTQTIVLDHCGMDLAAAEALRDALRQTFVVVLENNDNNPM